MPKRLLSLAAAAVPENIGLTGIARNPHAVQDLLAAYTAYLAQLEQSALPDGHPYKTAMQEYTSMATSMLRSDNPEALARQTGMQLEELLIECGEERDLLEALEKDQ